MINNFYENQETQFKSEIVNKHKAVDVIGCKLGGQVLDFSDEWFAAASNLIKPTNPIKDATKFVHSGAWYDGWETRRHNENEYDWVIIKMGVRSANIVGAEIDTSFFNGNQAPFVSIDALYDPSDKICESTILETNPSWVEIFKKTECGPSQRHFFIREEGPTKDRFNYIKLKMYPDGGIARFRLYGKVCPIVRDDNILTDLASVCNGAVSINCSDQHYGSTDNLILPGRGHDMSDGWETKRSREINHNDWVIIQLSQKSKFIEKIIVDTAHFRGNFPQHISVNGINVENGKSPECNSNDWIELVGKTKTGPDKEHIYEVKEQNQITHIKLTIFPDGGVKRVRVYGY